MSPFCAIEHVFGTRADLVPRCKEDNRIEVALNGATKVHAAPSVIQRDAPVDTDYLCARLFHGRQQCGTVRAEIDYRYLRFLEVLYQFCRTWKNVATVVVNTEASHPAIEYLKCIRPRSRLFGRILRCHSHQFGH